MKTIKQAREMYGFDASDDEKAVISRMALAVSTFYHDPAEFTSNVEIKWKKVDGKNRIEMWAEVTKDGVAVTPVRTLWEVWPNKTLPGLADNAQNRNASSQFPHQNRFFLTTDLRDREAYQIMSAGKIRVRVQCDLFETDGDRVPVMKEEVIDLTGLLPVYNYFG